MRTFIFATAFLLIGLAAGSIPVSDATAHWADVRGHSIYYEVRGSGHPLLLLHGGGASISASFSRQIDAFAATYKIIAPEQVGQGHSPDISGPLSYTEMMEDTAALLEQLHVTDVDVVGWSDGGILALMLAVKYPHLVHSVVISGVNIAPDGLLDSDRSDQRNTAATSIDSEKIEVADNAPINEKATIDEKLRQLWASAPTITELNVALLQHLQKPVLVLTGDHDVIKLDHTMEIYRALPQAQLSVLPNTGHATFEQRPELVNPMVLNFLAQN
ncbi:MAG: hypothetical protein JWM78_281 [Verrucomicrobiaceae bacterium]|nr:hypothetical protein [Verrucomicrobiaceae bacterium]